MIRPLRHRLSDEAVAVMDEQRAAGQTPQPVHLMLVDEVDGRERGRTACGGGLGEWVTGALEQVTCAGCRQVESDRLDQVFTEQMQRMVREVLAEQMAVIETACEKALQGGEHGVLVLRAGHGGTLISAEPDPSVPYGQIHERPA